MLTSIDRHVLSSLLLLSLSALPACSNAATTATTTEVDASTASPSPSTLATPPAPVTAVKIERETNVRESGAVVLGRVADAVHAFVADEDDGAIVEVDAEHNAIIATTPVGVRLRDLLLLPDGRIVATLPDHGSIAIFSRDAAGALHEDVRVHVADEPLSMALDPTDAMLYVSTGSSHSLVAFAVKSGSGANGATAFEEHARFSLGREPRAVLVTSDGAHVIVTHASESFVSVVSTAGSAADANAKIETRDISNRTMCSGGQCSGARTARGVEAIARVGDRGIVIPATQSLPVPPSAFTKSYLCAPDRDDDLLPDNSSSSSSNSGRARSAAVARRSARRRGDVTGYGIGSGEAGPPINFDLEMLDGKDASTYGVGTPPPAGPSCLLPRAAAAAGDSVLVTCLGSSRVARYRATAGLDFTATHPATPERFVNGTVVNVSMDAIAVPAGPTGIAIERDNAHAVVWSSFARTMTRLDIAVATPPAKSNVGSVVGSVEIPRHIARDEAWLAGRALFFTNGDKRIAVDGRTCGNCHIDGRDDGLAWKTPNGMRRTRMLAGQAATGPYGWKGDAATLSDHIKTTMKNLEGTGLPDAELTQLATYVASIAKMPSSSSSSSSTATTATTSAIKDPDLDHGRELFTSAECTNCHATGTSDRVVHDVGTGGGYLTPTLANVSMRRQLMHDGRFHTLDDLIANSKSMGRGATLTPEDRHALVKYLATL